MMAADQGGYVPSPPVAPPTERAPLPAPPPSAGWAAVIGIIGIVLGGLGLLGGLWGLAAPAWIDMMRASMPAVSRVGLDVAARWMVWTLIASLISAAIAVLLLLGGVGLVRRRRSSLPLISVWAIVKIVWAVIMAIVGSMIQRETLAAMQAQGMNVPRFGAGFAAASASIGLVLTVLWGCALPVFVLIWFARRRIKAQMAEWR